MQYLDNNLIVGREQEHVKLATSTQQPYLLQRVYSGTKGQCNALQKCSLDGQACKLERWCLQPWLVSLLGGAIEL